jgi:hypothetical protein
MKGDYNICLFLKIVIIFNHKNDFPLGEGDYVPLGSNFPLGERD